MKQRINNQKVPESSRVTYAPVALDYKINQPLSFYQIKHQPTAKSLPSTTNNSRATCIIKNKLNPAIMLYQDNQKSLLHFLPVSPSGHRVTECIFPMSSQPVSH